MREHGIVGAKRRGRPWRTTTSDPSAERAPDRVDRNFTAVAPDRLWVADFTYARCWEGPVFFSFVLDVFSRKLVGWQFTSHMRTSLVQDALEMALATRKRGADVDLVHHSDAGSQLGLKESSQHRVLGGYTVEPRAGRVVVRPRRVARRASRSGRTTTRCGPGAPGGGPSRCRSWPEMELRLLRRGVHRGPLPGCAIRASCGAGC